uniref:hypothetical protein n=2 Tax=Flavobacterium sp. TaxID=239 RepID=UPI004049B318
MECFVIFVMAWCWCNATESKPQNVVQHFGKQKMNLKTLISIKFIIYIIGFIIIAYFSGNINNSYKNLENQNEELLNQKKYYEAILKLDKNDSVGKKNLYYLIEAGNYKLKPESENELKLSTYINIFIISILILFYLFNYLNNKIEKLKSEETEDEKIKML